jgi:hypothetical protein
MFNSMMAIVGVECKGGDQAGLEEDFDCQLTHSELVQLRAVEEVKNPPSTA